MALRCFWLQKTYENKEHRCYFICRTSEWAPVLVFCCCCANAPLSVGVAPPGRRNWFGPVGWFHNLFHGLVWLLAASNLNSLSPKSNQVKPNKVVSSLLQMHHNMNKIYSFTPQTPISPSKCTTSGAFWPIRCALLREQKGVRCGSRGFFRAGLDSTDEASLLFCSIYLLVARRRCR